MRYRSYSEEEYIDKCSSEKFMDEYDPMPNCTSYLTYCGKKTIGSIRSCVFDPIEKLSIPVMDVFDEEIRTNVGYEHTMIEANKFVVDPSFQKQGGVRARFSIYKNIADEIVDRNAKYLVAAIRTEHIKFYKMLNFEQASDIKSYPHLNFQTLFVVCENVDGFCDKIYSKTVRKDLKRKAQLEINNGALLSNGSN
ncbi:MAG: hypothetical protein K6L81_00840 [Agarilytica sp.]